MNNQLTQIAQIMKGRDPKQTALQMIANSNITDPTVLQLIKYAESGNTQQLYPLATQFLNQRGVDIDADFMSFLSLIK